MTNSDNPELTPTTGSAEVNREIISKDITRTGVVFSSSETVNRFGSANAEFIKGYSGIDNETGQKFAKGLADIGKHKVNANPSEGAKNIKQQAGFSAEVATTSRDNAEAIIGKSRIRTSRSDDLLEFGRNHNVVDRVQILDGQIIEGTQSQMKFVGDRDQLLERVAREDGKFKRYRGIKLELPSEQFEGAKEHCQERAKALRQQADLLEKMGKPEAALKLRGEATNFEQLAENVSDSGLTTEQAIFYRKHPEIGTAIDIAHTSHRAGIEGAKFGSIIGGCISLLQNSFAVAQGKKEMETAVLDVASCTAKAATVGYGTAFLGSAIKGTMQQSQHIAVRTLANTSVPVLVVNVCLSLGSSVKQFAMGEITEAQLLLEVGEKGAGMLSSSMMAAIGQVAIPIPFVGAAIGGMIGYTLSSLFYQGAVDAATGVQVSREGLERTLAIQAAARIHIATQRDALKAFTSREIPQLQQEVKNLFSVLDTVNSGNGDAMAASINHFATLLGKQLQFQSITEFNDFMTSDQPLRL